MRCRQCGNEMLQIKGKSVKVKEGYWQTTREYLCKKCRNTQIVTDDPVFIGGDE